MLEKQSVFKKANKNLHELLFVLYLSTFALVGLLVPLSPIPSFILLLVPTLTILSTSVIRSIRDHTLAPSRKWLLITAATTLLLIIDGAFRPNSYTATYAYQFVIFGVIPLYLLSKVKDLRAVFRFSAIISALIISLYIFDPLIEYPVTKDYLKFGYFIALPSYLSLYIGRKYLSMGKLWPFEITSLIYLALFSNRGALVTGMFFILATKLFIDSKNLKKSLFIITFTTLIVILSVYAKPVLSYTINRLEANNISSYSVKAMYEAVADEGDLYSGRQDIWDKSVAMYNESPIVGSGVGKFIAVHGVYSHNIFLEVLNNWGVVGVSAFVLLALLYIRTIMIAEGLNKLFILEMGALGLVPLLFSLGIFLWIYFWIFIYCIGINSPFGERHEY